MSKDVKDEIGFILNQSPSHLLHRAQQYAADKFESIRDAGLTLRQFAVLAAVDEKEGCSQSELVKSTGIDRSTLAEMVKRMADKDLVERRPDKLDGRANALFMTDKGRASLKTATPMVRSADAEILDALPKNRQRSFIAILALLANAADEEALKLLAEDREEKRRNRKGDKDKDRDADKKKKKKKKKK